MCSYQLDSRQKDTSSAYFYKTEIEVKNRQIADLKSKIDNLLKEKSTLHSKVSNLQMQNYSMNSSCEQEVKNQNQQWAQTEQALNNQIELLKSENQALRCQLNIKEGTENNFQSTFQNKISNAQKEVNNLGVMNTIKDNYLTQMTMFYNKLNCYCGEKHNYELDHYNDEVHVFKRRMKEIEDKVLNHIQFTNVHQSSQYPINESKECNRQAKDMGNNDNYNINRNSTNYKIDKENSNNYKAGYKYSCHHPEMPMDMNYNNRLHEEKRKKYNDYCAGVRIYNNETEEKKRESKMKIKYSRYSHTRTPPRDKEYEPRE